MNVDIYKAGRKNCYLFLPQGKLFSSLPQAVLDELETLQLFKTGELNADLIATNPDAVKADFKKQGYSIRGIEVEFTIVR